MVFKYMPEVMKASYGYIHKKHAEIKCNNSRCDTFVNHEVFTEDLLGFRNFSRCCDSRSSQLTIMLGL